MTSAGRRIVACALVASVPALVPAPAAAEITDVTFAKGDLGIKASDAADEVTVSAAGKSVTIDDPDGVPAAASPCKGGPPSSIIRCPRNRVDEIAIDLGDGDDRFDGDGGIPFEVEGDKGNDEIDGGDAGDLLEGKLGDDTIDGSEGSDEVLGGLDDDSLFGKAGKDVVEGGPGDDDGDGGAGKDRCFGLEREKGCE